MPSKKVKKVFYSITVPVEFNRYANEEHPLVQKLAVQHEIEHEGGGMWLEGTMYDHDYGTKDKAKAEAFAGAVRKAGFKPRLRQLSNA